MYNTYEKLQCVFQAVKDYCREKYEFDLGKDVVFKIMPTYYDYERELLYKYYKKNEVVLVNIKYSKVSHAIDYLKILKTIDDIVIHDHYLQFKNLALTDFKINEEIEKFLNTVFPVQLLNKWIDDSLIYII